MFLQHRDLGDETDAPKKEHRELSREEVDKWEGIVFESKLSAPDKETLRRLRISPK